MRTSVTTAAPQLAAAGLGVAVTPVSAGTAGAVRSFAPHRTRPLVAVTRPDPHPLVARFVADLQKRGLRVPREVRSQLTAPHPGIGAPRRRARRARRPTRSP